MLKRIEHTPGFNPSAPLIETLNSFANKINEVVDATNELIEFAKKKSPSLMYPPTEGE